VSLELRNIWISIPCSGSIKGSQVFDVSCECYNDDYPVNHIRFEIPAGSSRMRMMAYTSQSSGSWFPYFQTPQIVQFQVSHVSAQARDSFTTVEEKFCSTLASILMCSYQIVVLLILELKKLEQTSVWNLEKQLQNGVWIFGTVSSPCSKFLWKLGHNKSKIDRDEELKVLSCTSTNVTKSTIPLASKVMLVKSYV
jgi:hypothetical protein